MAPSSTREQIAANVRAEVARKQKTQADVAAVLGKTQQAISAKFRGETAFTAEEMAAIAESLDISVTALIGETAGAA